MSTDLLARIPGWEREAEVFEEKARALRQMIESVQVLNGDAARLFDMPLARPGDAATRRTNQYRPEEGPRGREAVRRVTSERPGVWKLRDIVKEISKRGWPSSPTAIATAVQRMQAAGEAEWVKTGAYKFGATAPFVAMTVKGVTE